LRGKTTSKHAVAIIYIYILSTESSASFFWDILFLCAGGKAAITQGQYLKPS
jgi:hypothetical protein